MSKRKSFHARIAATTAQDMSAFFSLDQMNQSMTNAELPGMGDHLAGSQLVDSRFLTLQEEAHFVGFFEEEHEITDDDPYYYPGLLKAWEESPCSVLLTQELKEALACNDDSATLSTPWQRLEQLFPACLLVDIRGTGFSLYGMDVDALYVYPSFDEQLETVLLLLVGVSESNGLRFPAQSKMTLSGITFADALKASRDQRMQIMQTWGDMPLDPHWTMFSPYDDDDALLQFAAQLFSLALGDEGTIKEEKRKSVSRLELGYHHQAETSKAIAQEESPDTSSDETNESAKEEQPIAAPAAYTQEEAFELHLRVEELQKVLVESQSRIAQLNYNLSAAQASAQAAEEEARSLRQQAALLSELDLPQSPLQALELAERAFGDRLIIMESARKSAARYEGSTAETWAALRSIATILQPLVFGDGTQNIIRSFESQSGFALSMRDSKATNRNASFQKLRTVDYEGQPRDITAHVKGRTRGHGDVLRIHFFADYQRQRVVIAHCGSHLPSTSSSFL